MADTTGDQDAQAPDMDGSRNEGEDGPDQAAPPGAIGIPPAADAPPDEQEAYNRAIIRNLDRFLDEMAAGHRERMNEVVTWLTAGGRLEHEIEASVNALSVLFHKWSIEICFLLRMHDKLRFNEIKSRLEGMGSRTLSQRLKDLEAQGIAHRQVFPEVPVRVEYSLTQRGLRMADLFLPVIAHLRITARPPGEAEQPAEASG